MLVEAWLVEGDTNETRRSHREDSRYQAREGLDMEAHLQGDRRLFRVSARWRAARPDEADQAAGRQGGRAVRPVASRDRDAQRGADARRRRADVADRPADLSLL